MGRLSPFCSVCSAALAGGCTGLRHSSLVLSCCPCTFCTCGAPGTLGVLLGTAQVSLEPCAAGRAQGHWCGAHCRQPPALSLGDLYWLQYLWLAETWGKGSKTLPAALWDTLGLVSPAVLGFIRLCRSTKLSFYLILFLSLTPRYFPVLPRIVEPVGRFRDRISRQLKSLLLLNVTKLQSHLNASKLDQFCGVH